MQRQMTGYRKEKVVMKKQMINDIWRLKAERLLFKALGKKKSSLKDNKKRAMRKKTWVS